MLELINASMNFYIYFACVREIRSHFYSVTLKCIQGWKTRRDRDLEITEQEQSVSKIQNTATNMRRRISTVSSEMNDFITKPKRSFTSLMPKA